MPATAAAAVTLPWLWVIKVTRSERDMQLSRARYMPPRSHDRALQFHRFGVVKVAPFEPCGSRIVDSSLRNRTPFVLRDQRDTRGTDPALSVAMQNISTKDLEVVTGGARSRTNSNNLLTDPTYQ